MKNGQRFFPYVVLAAAVFAVYANIYDNVLLFDDDLLIHLNSYLRSWATFGKLLTASTTEGAHIAGGFYRPVQNLLYFFIFQIDGENPLGFHLLNLSAHAGCACLGYRLALRLGLDPRAALIGMLFWAVHPLHTEAITYMSGSADPLFVFFCLWALNVLMPSPTMRRVLASLPLFALALLSKETAVVLPALVCVCLYFVSDERRKARTYAVTWPLWLIAFAYLAWRVNAEGFDGPARYAQLFRMHEYSTLRLYSEDPAMRLMTFLATLPSYAALLLWPADLYMERSFPLYGDIAAAPVLLGLLMLLAALVTIGWSQNKPTMPLRWGLLWFGAAHAPNAGLLFPMNSLFLEHWMYLPTIGLFLGLAQSAVQILDRYKNTELTYGTLALALAGLMGFSARTYDQNEIWREPVVFYNNIFAHGAVSPRAHNNLAIAYMNQQNLPKGIEEYRRAIAEGDTYAETHYNLALALLDYPDQNSHMQEAIGELKRSLEIEPGFYRSADTLAQIYNMQGDKAQSDFYRKKAQDILNK